ncbi:MAG: ATP-dependent DNA helicase RecG [Peptococcaceae bacterium]|nr:ATP-dependent DNA helicase RecG [Peptococcaceae bacterium]
MTHLSDGPGAVKGIGPKKQRLLESMGISTMRDALQCYPFRYDDWSQLLPVSAWHDRDMAVFVGRVVQMDVQKSGRRQVKIVKAVLHGEQGDIVATWFGRYQMEKYLYPNVRLLVYGRVSRNYSTELVVQEHQFIKNDAQLARLLVVQPVYSLTEGLGKVDMIRLTDAALTATGELVEPLSEAVRARYGLLSMQEALHLIHRPRTMQDAERAYHDLVVYEFLALTLWGQVSKSRKSQGIAHTAPPTLADDFVAHLPYQLTGAQERAIAAIMADMRAPEQMHRLLQGDVGSGKTNVAFYAMLAAVSAGHQAALMAPTEVLARQHFAGAERAFAPLGVRVALLVGKMKTREREEVLAGLADGTIDCVVGTHALIEDPVQFKSLSMVVIDEQHRFGVRQREALERKGNHPDLLITTATPIPRSLALTVYGDLALTVIDEMPKNRQKIQTMWINSPRLAAMYGFIRDELAKGRQAFIVCPLVEESEKIDLENAISLAEQLQNDIFYDWQVGLLHGRMRPEEKEDIMQAFRERQTQVLVSTTVIEVGVDVPNATIMVIMNAERFGLAQLHQLRGRVGRGSEKSYCILVSDAKSEESQARLKLMATTASGFDIAEEDLRQRGPGELLGLRQHGQGLFRLARPGYHQAELALAETIAHDALAEPLTDGARDMICDIEKKIVP